MRFEGKVAIVTGSGSGIGQATAIRFAREGAKLVLNDINEIALCETLGYLRQCSNLAFTSIVGDISKETTAESLVREAVDAFGRVDILVNNAGVHHVGDITETSLEAWNRVIATNLTSMFLCAKHTIPTMLAQKSGVIINFSSISAFVGQEFDGKSTFVYNITKAGALQLSKSLATRYAADGIRINCICPGATHTNAIRFVNDAEAESFWKAVGESHPINRVATPAEIASAVAFLASDDASFMVGSALIVDGGYLSR